MAGAALSAPEPPSVAAPSCLNPVRSPARRFAVFSVALPPVSARAVLRWKTDLKHSTAVLDQIADRTGKKSRKADSRQMRVRELIHEVEGLDRLILSEGGPTEIERVLMEQRENLQRELDELRQVKAGAATSKPGPQSDRIGGW